jgi:hypothetical protein
MKIAICFYGKFTGKNNRGEIQSFKKPLKYFKKNILNADTDIFFHGWDDDEKSSEDIVESLNPKRFLLEKQIDFEHPYRHYDFVSTGPWNTKNYINNNYSRFYSLKKSVQLLDREYDLVLIARFDTVFYKPFPINLMDGSKFYVSNWHLNQEGWGFQDAWFMGGSSKIRDFSTIFDRLDNYFDVTKSGYIDHLKNHGFGLDSLPSGHMICKYRFIEMGMCENLYAIGLEYESWGLSRRIRKRKDPWGGFELNKIMIPNKIEC